MLNHFEDIFDINSNEDFEKSALRIFNIQARHVPVYKSFLEYLKIDPSGVESLEDIPFIPVEFFKYHKVLNSDCQPEVEFISSGTTGSINSRHFVADTELYKQSILRTFSSFYGSPDCLCILALLPSYLERSGSSLVYMVEYLIRESGNKHSGFYLNNLDSLIQTIIEQKAGNQKVMLIGVSFALMELAEKYNPDLSGIIVMETGGMKGMRKEMPRKELHAFLKENLNVSEIHSEYGMTELLSQAYSSAEGIFNSPPWMKILIRDLYDPFSYVSEGYNGAVNIIDLANVYSCAFLATSDLGRIIPGKGFEILGRLDSSDIRGCNLLVA